MNQKDKYICLLCLLECVHFYKIIIVLWTLLFAYLLNFNDNLLFFHVAIILLSFNENLLLFMYQSFN